MKLESSYIYIILCIMFINCEKINSELNKGECDSTTFNKLYCEANKAKVKYRVEAVYSQDSNKSDNIKSEMFSFSMPINRCKKEDCEFCCLSTNRCGTIRQCENSEYFMKYINYFFLGLIVILSLAFILKWFQIDGYPEQSNTEKIENMNELINMFGIIRHNRKKLIT